MGGGASLTEIIDQSGVGRDWTLAVLHRLYDAGMISYPRSDSRWVVDGEAFAAGYRAAKAAGESVGISEDPGQARGPAEWSGTKGFPSAHEAVHFRPSWFKAPGAMEALRGKLSDMESVAVFKALLAISGAAAECRAEAEAEAIYKSAVGGSKARPPGL